MKSLNITSWNYLVQLSTNEVQKINGSVIKKINSIILEVHQEINNSWVNGLVCNSIKNTLIKEYGINSNVRFLTPSNY